MHERDYSGRDPLTDPQHGDLVRMVGQSGFLRLVRARSFLGGVPVVIFDILNIGKQGEYCVVTLEDWCKTCVDLKAEVQR